MACAREHANYFRYHIAGSAYDHSVSEPHVLAFNFIHVVQGRVAHYGAAHHDRLEAGDGRERSGAADLEIDFSQHRQRLIGREFMCHGPARGPAHLAEFPLVGTRVDLIDDSIDLIGQLRAARCKRAVIIQASCSAWHDLRFGIGTQPPGGKLRQQLLLGRRMRNTAPGVRCR